MIRRATRETGAGPSDEEDQSWPPKLCSRKQPANRYKCTHHYHYFIYPLHNTNTQMQQPLTTCAAKGSIFSTGMPVHKPNQKAQCCSSKVSWRSSITIHRKEKLTSYCLAQDMSEKIFRRPINRSDENEDMLPLVSIKEQAIGASPPELCITYYPYHPEVEHLSCILTIQNGSNECITCTSCIYELFRGYSFSCTQK